MLHQDSTPQALRTQGEAPHSHSTPRQLGNGCSGCALLTSIRHIWMPGVVLLSVLLTLVLSSTMATGAAGKGTCQGVGNTLVNSRQCH